ncbi:MAG: single-strand DNA-binding protein [Parcubacteria group bacterium Gr01-1014_3]|nr:MAG: single-strand DNA-binding protein [Parcubacteria group bacterium Gr01-1014_3]
MNLNKVYLIGRMTADPILKVTPGNQQVTSFSIATNRVWKDKDGQKQDSTEFHNIVAWGKQAEVISKFMTKGSLLMVEGRLQTRSWDDKQGQKRKTTEIVAETVQFGPRQGGQAHSASSGQARAEGAGAVAPKAPEMKVEEIPTINIDEESSTDLPF